MFDGILDPCSQTSEKGLPWMNWCKAPISHWKCLIVHSYITDLCHFRVNRNHFFRYWIISNERVQYFYQNKKPLNGLCMHWTLQMDFSRTFIPHNVYYGLKNRFMEQNESNVNCCLIWRHARGITKLFRRNKHAWTLFNEQEYYNNYWPNVDNN